MDAFSLFEFFFLVKMRITYFLAIFRALLTTASDRVDETLTLITLKFAGASKSSSSKASSSSESSLWKKDQDKIRHLKKY